MKQIRFKRKTYGWGWTPATWQGWLTIFVYIITIRTILGFADQGIYISPVQGLYICIILTIGLIVISYLKGEKPRWQWGNKKSS